MNTKAITEIAQKSPTSEAFFTYAACRERNVREGVSRLSAIKAQMTKEGFHPVPQDLLAMFRELERAGVGQLHGDMFRWHVSIRKVGEAVVAPKEAPSVPEIKPRPPTNRSLVVYFDNGKEITADFTENLTRSEVENFCARLLKSCGT